jgi:hypothetical protein
LPGIGGIGGRPDDWHTVFNFSGLPETVDGSGDGILTTTGPIGVEADPSVSPPSMTRTQAKQIVY